VLYGGGSISATSLVEADQREQVISWGGRGLNRDTKWVFLPRAFPISFLQKKKKLFIRDSEQNRTQIPK
jgi:hypothetical protein